MTRMLSLSIRAGIGAILALFVAFNLVTATHYANASLDRVAAMNELPNWTSARAISQLVALNNTAPAGATIISDASDITVVKQEAAILSGRPLFFSSSYLWYNLKGSFNISNAWAMPLAHARFRALTSAEIRAHNAYTEAQGPIEDGPLGRRSAFDWIFVDPRMEQAVAKPRDTLLLRSFNQTLFNGWRHPGQLVPQFSLHPYRSIQNFLMYAPSWRGGYDKSLSWALWRFENDVFDPNKKMEAVGRYLVFNVVNPSKPFRLEIDFTATVLPEGSAIPPLSVIGEKRYNIATHGNGAARLFSPMLTPQIVNGLPFIELDMGRDGRVFPDRRAGVMRWFGDQYPLDYRKIVGFVRDISAMSEAQYDALRPPSKLSRFPNDLENPNLEFSGIYEDGWIAGSAAAWLSAPVGCSAVVLRGMAPEQSSAHLRVELFVDGKHVATTRPKPGSFVLRAPARCDGRRHEIEIVAAPLFQLQPPDHRPASIHLDSLGFESAT